MKRASSNRAQIYLTFDVEGPPGREDFFCGDSANILEKILKILNRNRLKGIFFVTGSAAERFCKYPRLVKLLNEHRIGYHSTVHSIRPLIFEYTDIADCKKAINRAKIRETSHVDIKTGKVKGRGGILLLREIFPDKDIDAFRAPFLCWSPPHFEALKSLGFKFDFSVDALRKPFTHKELTFYPSPVAIEKLSHFWTLGQPFESLSLVKPRVFDLFFEKRLHITLTHPSAFVKESSPVSSFARSADLLFFGSFAKCVSNLDEIEAIKVESEFRTSGEADVRDLSIENLCLGYMNRTMRLFNYRPKYLGSSIRKFFS